MVLSPAWTAEPEPLAADVALPLASKRDAARMDAWAASPQAHASPHAPESQLREQLFSEARKAQASGRSVDATLDATLEHIRRQQEKRNAAIAADRSAREAAEAKSREQAEAAARAAEAQRAAAAARAAEEARAAGEGAAAAEAHAAAEANRAAQARAAADAEAAQAANPAA